MTGFSLIIAFIVAIVLMIFFISKFKIHPFLAIMGISLLLGVVAGIPLADHVVDGEKVPGIATIIGQGFSGTFASIGIVIIFGALIGNILETTGAALKFADMVIRLVGRRHPVLGMELMGWVVSIPVFCDSGFVILNPIRKAIVRRTGASSVAMTFGLAAGLDLSHVFIPPTPGPIASASTLGMGDNILMVIGFGVLCSIFPIVVGLCYANFIGKRVKADDEADSSELAKTYEELVASYGKLPSAMSSLAPILVPLILMAISSVVAILGTQGDAVDVAKFLGTPIIALAAGALFAIAQLFVTGKGDKFYALTNDTLKMVGPILFITAAGGVLGKIISSTDMVNFITSHADILKSVGIFFPFLLSAILKTAQGSSTVAMTTTAGIVAPLLVPLGFTTPVGVVLVCMSIGAGSLVVSHANDSYFWVVTNFGSLTPAKGYRVQTVGSLVIGLSAFVEILILSLIFS